MTEKELDNKVIEAWAIYQSKSENPTSSQLKFMFAMDVQTNNKSLFNDIKRLYPNSDHHQIIAAILSKYPPY